mmetsp:Transcript_45125/g.84212  ORF Transcript_45125/g.84212 Transcript_45125/m.84212 type:complete len:154 (-) Transcript_45125:78-539(-)|eukprot:CAMPEP_0184029156 /NCGR_PEP_ID=MMETSP0955-20130417/151_1 /TAXON_ID=627963 /ORGANISM="Aplanochytrium sp, Strain PBS07" /LENGTH=153 /DNA_ID=CAMNT_0026314147 /DNA_START=280 /DNA_END=741 /DNA_ORIENTATION=-
MSGITATPESIEFYNQFKLQRNSKSVPVKYRYVIYRIVNNDQNIDVVEKGDWETPWDDFVDNLSSAKDEKGKPLGAYAVFDMEFETLDGREQQKLVFVAYTPDSLPVKQRMLYGSTRESFKSELGSGIHYTVQASSIDDLDLDRIVSAMRNKV